MHVGLAGTGATVRVCARISPGARKVKISFPLRRRRLLGQSRAPWRYARCVTCVQLYTTLKTTHRAKLNTQEIVLDNKAHQSLNAPMGRPSDSRLRLCAGYGDRGAPRGRWGESPGSRGCVTSHAGHSCVTVTTWAPGGWSLHWHSHTHSDGANIKCNNPLRKDSKTYRYEKFSSVNLFFSLPLRNPFETL